MLNIVCANLNLPQSLPLTLSVKPFCCAFRGTLKQIHTTFGGSRLGA